jgi:deoxyribodipyrimidine photo-lyase
MLQVVWFKKDLRCADHAPLVAAINNANGNKHINSNFPDVLPLYVYEPSLLQAPDTATQHVAFANECLVELQAELHGLGLNLCLQHAEMLEVLARIKQQYGVFCLHSHEETGNDISYQRDIAVGKCCKQNGIVWHEYPQTAVVRRLPSRDVWTKLWQQRMTAPLITLPTTAYSFNVADNGLMCSGISTTGILSPSQLGLVEPDKPERQQGGRKRALIMLEKFLYGDLGRYRFGLSSPLTAAHDCARISPYLTFGVISMREVLQQVWQRRHELQAMPEPARPTGALASLKAFEGRLHWHCHFIQKLEDQPSLELVNMNRRFDGLREGEFNENYFQAWCKGETGYPLVDACMKMLLATGWLNFRMRAMLISFSSYQLWNHWQRPAHFLAKQFLDYEPGIHYPQIQMQSGVTGINTLRIYNPVKQAQDQDAKGIFVRRWLPALRTLPNEFLFEPWAMPVDMQEHIGFVLGKHYPAPIVEHQQAARESKLKLWSVRKDDDTRLVSKQVMEKHGSRKVRTKKTTVEKASLSKQPRAGRKVVSTEQLQPSLFDD